MQGRHIGFQQRQNPSPDILRTHLTNRRTQIGKHKLMTIDALQESAQFGILNQVQIGHQDHLAVFKNLLKYRTFIGVLKFLPLLRIESPGITDPHHHILVIHINKGTTVIFETVAYLIYQCLF